MPNGDHFVSVGLQRTNRKIGKIVTLYQRELCKKIPRLGTFCTQSVHKVMGTGSLPGVTAARAWRCLPTLIWSRG
jgi:hypothetical protein